MSDTSPPNHGGTEDKRKTAPPTSSFLNPQQQQQQSPLLPPHGDSNNRTIGVAPLRTSFIISKQQQTSSSNTTTNNNNNNNSNNNNGGGISSNTMGGASTAPIPPQRRIVSVSSPSSPIISENGVDSNQNNGSSSNNIINTTKSNSSNNLLQPNNNSNSPTTNGSKTPSKVPPKVTPRSSISSLNLNVDNSSRVTGGGSSITSSPSHSSNSLLSPDKDKDDSSVSSGGNRDSFLDDDRETVVDGDESDDDTDEEEETLHENFLKELGLGNKERINDLKEQEKKELELLAGGNKFRVTRCFVMQPNAPPPQNQNTRQYKTLDRHVLSKQPQLQQPNQQQSNHLNNNTNQTTPNANRQLPQQPQQQQQPNDPLRNPPTKLNRQTIYNPRYSIYRPLPGSQHAPPKKPLPTPPQRKLPPQPKQQQQPQYTKEQENAAIKIQRCYRRYKLTLPFKRLKILYRYRWNIVQEIYNTEKTYLKTLEQLQIHFIEPLRKNGIISQDDVKFIFGGLDTIIVINTTLMTDIENILKNWTPYSILGKSFCTLGVFLKAYTDYVKNFDFSLQRIEACSKDVKFVQFIKNAEERTNPRSRLESLLITPVQRIPRYVLLLQDLLKHTEESHPDFPHISEGLDIIKKVAISINDTKRRADNSLKVIEVQNKLVGKFPNLVVADRRYVYEGLLSYGSSKEKTKKAYIFLFNDILIFSKPSSNKLFSKSKFKFVKTEDLGSTPRITDIPSNPIFQNAFEIEIQNVTCTFSAESEEIKKLWVDHITKIFNDLNRQSGVSDKLEKRAVEKADQAKTYIDNFFTNIKVKGRVTRGATIRQNGMGVGLEQENLVEQGSEQQLLSSTSTTSTTNPNNNGGGLDQSNNQSNDLAQSQKQPILSRQATFHNMTLLQREERLKGLAEETSQLKMEHQKQSIEQTLSPENKYASIKLPMGNGATMIGDGSSSVSEKKTRSAPSLNKIFSSINLTSNSSGSGGSGGSSGKESKSSKSPSGVTIGKPPISNGAPLFPTLTSKQASSLNVSFNNELHNSLSKKTNS